MSIYFNKMSHWFYFYLFIFNWRIIALHYGAGFCHTSAWASHRCVWIYISPPSWGSPSYLPAHPTPLGCHRALALSSLHHNSKSPLAIYFTYGSVYVSMLLSQFTPPSPSRTGSASLFSTSMSLLLPCR